MDVQLKQIPITDLPAINPGLNYTIPFQTPFKLTGSATDPNNDPLTYCWEQYNLGNASNWNAPAGDAPIFVVQSRHSAVSYFPKDVRYCE